MIKKALIIVFVFALFGGCSNKLNLLAPYKESVSIYALLNQDDPIHYVRVDRVFLGATNAYIMAQNQDSAYFGAGELTVTMQRWIKNGPQVSVDIPTPTPSSSSQIVLTDTLMQADAGIFNQNERVYKTTHPLYSDTNCQYKLIIHNNKTGKEFTAQTGLVSDFQLISVQNADNKLEPAYGPNTPVDIVPTDVYGIVTCRYNSPANAGVCGLTMRLFYTENSSAHKYVDLGLGTNYPITTYGGETQNFDYLGKSLLGDISVSIPVNPSVVRTADSIEFILTAGGYDLALYNQVNTSTSLSQNKPNYSNVSGGVGIFSSRHQLSLKRILTPQCLDTLSGNSLVCKLRFLNSNNALSNCH
jgi:hypothetical protein